MVKKRLQTTAEMLDSLRRILVNSLWIAIVLIVLAAGGWLILQSQLDERRAGSVGRPELTVKPVRPEIDWQQVDGALAAALQSARLSAREYAAGQLDAWIASMMERVDQSFLDWYFSYWTQQLLGLKGLYQYGVHYVLKSQPTASEKLTEEIQAEFAARVLQPQIAQKTLERIVNETASRYVGSLRRRLEEIPATYSIGRAEWQSYLEDIAITSGSVEGARQTPLTLKTLTVSGAGGAALLAANMKTAISKAGSKLMAKSTGKMASSLAAKTGGKVVAKAGGKFFGAIAGFGVLIWDVWDHRLTEKENRPQLKRSLADYFQELKLLLLDDPETGIMTTFRAFEHQLTAQDAR